MQFKLVCASCGYSQTRDIPPGVKEVSCTRCLGPVTVQSVSAARKPRRHQS